MPFDERTYHCDWDVLVIRKSFKLWFYETPKNARVAIDRLTEPYVSAPKHHPMLASKHLRTELKRKNHDC